MGLVVDQPEQVTDVEEVAHLFTFAAISEISEFSFPEMGGNPVNHHPLVDLSHLVGSGDDPTAVDHRFHAIKFGEFADQQLRSQFTGTIKRAGSVKRKVLVYSIHGNPGDGLGGMNIKPGRTFGKADTFQFPDRIYPAGGEENEISPVF